MHLQTGAAHPEELEDILQLMCESFHLPYQQARAIYYADPDLRAEDKLVVRVNSRPEACLTLMPALWQAGRAPLSILGISALATRQQSRGRGYATQLLAAARQEAQNRGAAMLALLPSHQAFYARRGWHVISTRCCCSLPLTSLQAPQQTSPLLPIQPQNIPALQTLRDTQPLWSLRKDRTERRWNAILQRFPYSRMIVENNNAPTGYIIAGIQPGSMLLHEPPISPVLKIEEFCAVSPAAEHTLLQGIAEFKSMQQVEFYLPWPQLQHLGLPGLPGAVVSAADECMGIAARFDLLLHSLGSCLQECDTPLVFRLSEQPCRQEMLCRQGTLEPISHCSASSNSTFSASAGLWAALATGQTGAEEALNAGAEFQGADRDLDMLFRLFPAQKPSLALPDYF